MRRTVSTLAAVALPGFAAREAEHGEMVLMAPKKEGFNLLAYFLPGAAVVTVGSILLWFLWKGRERAAAVQAAEQADLSGLSAEDRERLEAELANLES